MMAADVCHAGVQPKRLGDVDAILFVDGEGDRVGEQRLGGPQFELEASRDADSLARANRLVRSRVDARLVDLRVLAGGERGKEDARKENKTGEDAAMHGRGLRRRGGREERDLSRLPRDRAIVQEDFARRDGFSE